MAEPLTKSRKIHRRVFGRSAVALPGGPASVTAFGQASNPGVELVEQSKVLESQSAQEIETSKRTQLEFEIKDRKPEVERYKMLAERKREREQQLSAQLRAEQSKLTELEGRLDALEREIEGEVDRQRTEDASQEGKKRP